MPRLIQPGSLFAVMLLTGLMLTYSQAQTATAPSPATDESEYQMPLFNEHYTYHQRSGNRTIAGQGTFPDVRTLDSPALSGEVRWLTGANSGQPDWLATDGTQRRILSVVDDTLVSAAPTDAPPGVPFLIRDITQRYFDFQTVQNAVSSLSHPVLLTDFPADPLPLSGWLPQMRFAGVADNGDLLLLNANGQVLDSAALSIQPDARVVVDSGGRMAVYANATDARYVHGIMGDDIEGAALIILQAADDTLNQLARVDLPGDAVYEGLSPFWGRYKSGRTRRPGNYGQ